MGYLVIGLSGIVVNALLNGLVLKVLWRWFMVPVFYLPEISVVQAIGLAVVVSYLTYHHVDCQPRKEPVDERLWSALINGITQPLGFLAVGWIVHFFL